MLLAGLAAAQTFPPLTGRVVDAAGILSPAQEVALTQLSDEVERASTRQLVVATVASLEDRPIEDYGYRLGRAWKIGQDESNNGIILLVAPNERQVRIEVGYGLEPIMTDALSSTIIQDRILPRFRDGDMGGGIVTGAQAIAEQLRLPPEEAERRAQTVVRQAAPRRARGGSIDFITIFWIVVILFFVLPMLFGRSKGRRYRRGRGPVVIWGPGWGGGGGGSSWGGGGGSWGGGGGGFSGGGGSFGGGGASGSW